MSVTRDYALELERQPAPMLSVFGGKLTTYRRLAEDAVDLVDAALARRGARWTAGALLPGGDLPHASLAVFLRTLARRYPWLPDGLRLRYALAYGTRIERVLDGAASPDGLGEEILPQLYERELEYLCREEFAHSAQDILWRRSKLGLHLARADVGPLERWLAMRERASAPRHTAPPASCDRRA